MAARVRWRSRTGAKGKWSTALMHPLGNHRSGAAIEPSLVALLDGLPDPTDLTKSAAIPLWVDRERALYGAWYELFPRSYGGLTGAAERLPAVANMGFDVVYVPPVHPIGRAFRKG